MTVGDVLELAAAGLASSGIVLVIAGLVSWVVAAGAGLLMLCVFLLYLAQVWSEVQILDTLPLDPEDPGHP